MVKVGHRNEVDVDLNIVRPTEACFNQNVFQNLPGCRIDCVCPDRKSIPRFGAVDA